MTDSPDPDPTDRTPRRVECASRRPPAPPLDPGGDALFLDLDGTLAAIRPHPRDVGPDARRNALLRRLHARMQGRLAVVTGRGLDDAARILEDAIPTIAAIHGLVLREADGTVSAPAPAEGIDAVRQELLGFASTREGLLVEDKGISIALHFRNAAHLARDALARATDLAQRHGLTPQPGDMLIELRTPGADKGSAVKRLMALAPFAGARPVFAGDDLTDEHGFRAARELGGHGVLVGDREGLSAEYHLADHEAVLAWLEAAL